MGNSPGVDIQVPHFGTTKGVSYLDPSLYHPGEYFADMVEALVKLGLVDGLSLRAAPYDFRYAPGKKGWIFFDKIITFWDIDKDSQSLIIKIPSCVSQIRF